MLVLAEQNRSFGYAVAASLALHAMLLASLPSFRQAAAPPPEPPLVAHLVEPPAPPAPPPPAPPLPLPPEVRKPAPPRHIAKPKPKPMTVPRPAAPAAIAEPAPAPPPSPPPAAEPPSQAPSVAPPAPAPAAPPVDPAVVRDRFRQDLIAKAEQLKRYPKKAVDEGWTGRVTVRVEMAENGSVASVRVQSSSGNPLLDAVAVETFGAAAAQVGVPPALRGKAFAVEVPMLYKFTD